MDERSYEILYPVNSQFPSPRANSIQVIHTCHALAEQGARVRLIIRAEGSGGREEILHYYGLPENERLTIEPIRTRRLGSDIVFNASFQVSMVRALLRGPRPGGRRRVVYTRDALCATTALRARWILRTPLVYEVHALNHWTSSLFSNIEASPRRTRRLKRREQYVYGHAAAIVAISASCRDALASVFRAPRGVEVVPDATSLFVDPGSKRLAARPKLLYIGQFYPWKGVDTLVRAMAHLPEYSLDLYGGDYFTAAGDLGRLRALAAESGTTGALNFRGFVQPGQMGEVLRDEYIGILPAADNVMGRHFISPLKLFEYMGCCIPVVASDLPPIREIVTDLRNGLLFRPGDPIDLAEKVRMIAEDATLRQGLARRAYEDARGYSYANRARRILDILDRLPE